MAYHARRRSAGVLLLLVDAASAWSTTLNSRPPSLALRALKTRRRAPRAGDSDGVPWLGAASLATAAVSTGELDPDIVASIPGGSWFDAATAEALAAWISDNVAEADSIQAAAAVVSSAWSNFLDNGFMATHPVLTAGITAAVLATVGDSIAQGSTLLQQRNVAREKLGVQPDPATGSVPNPPPWEYYDAERGVAFAVFGFGYTGVFQYYWFQWLNAEAALMLPDTLPPLAIGLFKTVLNQCFMVPLVYFPLFFALTGALAGLSVTESVQRAQDRFLALLVRGWAFWLPVQVAMFVAVPPPLQLTFSSSAGVCWTAILSALTGSQTTPAEVPDTPLLEDITLADLGEAYLPEYVSELWIDEGALDDEDSNLNLSAVSVSGGSSASFALLALADPNSSSCSSLYGPALDNDGDDDGANDGSANDDDLGDLGPPLFITSQL